jgi:hypothetical protein
MSQSSFLVSYGQVMSRSWEDAEYRDRLLADPKSVLAEAGINVRDDARINVITVEPTGSGKFEDQVEMWARGDETGVYDLMVPTRPTYYDLEDAPLSDEMLEAVAGGTAAGCCCCCPCCCGSCFGSEVQ